MRPACRALRQVDATQFQGGPAEPACWASPLLRDQISIADVVVGSKADLVCDDAALEAFHSWARQLFPPKRLVATARHGRLDAAAHEAVIGQLQRNEGGVGSGSQTDGLQQGAGAGAAAEEPAPQAGVHGLPVQRHRRSVASTPWLSSSVSAAQDEAPPGRQPLRKQVQDASGAYAACG